MRRGGHATATIGVGATATMGVALVAWLVYWHGAARSAWVGDSGDLVTAVGVLGVPHPSGYPLWVLAGRAWSEALPIGSLAFELSLFSAAATAAACAVLHRLALRLRLGPWPALLGALLAAFAPAVWSQATAQRVYGLNLLFFATALLLATRWRERIATPPRATSARGTGATNTLRARDGALVAAAAACGLGASNHLFMAVQGIATLAWAVAIDPSLLRRLRSLTACAAAFAAGLLPYLYLPWSARRDPPLAWGDPETLDAVLGVVTRREYWSRAWVSGPADAAAAAWHVLAGVPREITATGAALAVVGLVAALSGRSGDIAPLRRLRRDTVALLVLVAAAGAASVIAHGQWHDIFRFPRYHAPLFAAAAILAAIGACVILARLPRRLAPLVLLLPAVSLAAGWQAFDRSGTDLAERHARALLDEVPPGGRLVAETDSVLFPLLHARHVLRLREDVDLVPVGLGRHAPEPSVRDPGTPPPCFTHRPELQPSGSLRAVPLGLTWTVLPRTAPLPPAGAIALPDTSNEPDDLSPAVLADSQARHLVAHAHVTAAATLAERERWLEAARMLRDAEALAADLPSIHADIAALLIEHGRPERALRHLRHAAALDDRMSAEARQRAAPMRTLLARVEADAARRARHLATLPTWPAVRTAGDDAARARALAALLERDGAPRWARGQRWIAAELANDLPIDPTKEATTGHEP